MTKIKTEPINVSNTRLSLKAGRGHRKFDAKQAKRHDFGEAHCVICDEVFTKYHPQLTVCSEECKKEKNKRRHRKYYEKNREKAKAYGRKYYEKNREKAKAYARKHYEKNSEKILARQRKHHEENREEIRARERERYHAKKKERLDYKRE